ncbi:MAG: DMT family transporter [Armatimonadota bacterium]
MQGNLTLGAFGLMCVSVTLMAFAQVIMKLGLGKTDLAGDSLVRTFCNILRVMFSPRVISGLSMYVISAFLWILVLSKVRLSVAYPMLSISYFLVVILSATVLHERVNWKMAGLGLFFISAGVSFIGFGLGQGH